MAERDSASERLLYHGTSHDVPDAIAFRTLIFVCLERMPQYMGKGHISQQVRVTVTIIQHLIQKVITICLLRKF